MNCMAEEEAEVVPFPLHFLLASAAHQRSTLMPRSISIISTCPTARTIPCRRCERWRLPSGSGTPVGMIGPRPSRCWIHELGSSCSNWSALPSSTRWMVALVLERRPTSTMPGRGSMVWQCRLRFSMQAPSLVGHRPPMRLLSNRLQNSRSRSSRRPSWYSRIGISTCPASIGGGGGTANPILGRWSKRGPRRNFATTVVSTPPISNVPVQSCSRAMF
mmetsp:Transcript_12520/g.27053  ORF Transcript_12520/g.27053 Transcript_12520/m.27053 type:complete len:218 (+) Transcript_12520:550-1203(+)